MCTRTPAHNNFLERRFNEMDHAVTQERQLRCGGARLVPAGFALLSVLLPERSAIVQD